MSMMVCHSVNDFHETKATLSPIEEIWKDAYRCCKNHFVMIHKTPALKVQSPYQECYQAKVFDMLLDCWLKLG